MEYNKDVEYRVFLVDRLEQPYKKLKRSQSQILLRDATQCYKSYEKP